MKFILVLSITITTVVFAQQWGNQGWNNPGSNLNSQIAQSQANSDWSIAQANRNVEQSDMNAARFAAQNGNPLGAQLLGQAAQSAGQQAQQYRGQGFANEQAARQDQFGGGGGFGRQGWERRGGRR